MRIILLLCVVALLVLASCELLETGVVVAQDPDVQREAGNVIRAVGTMSPAAIATSVVALINAIYSATETAKRRSANKELYKRTEKLEARLAAKTGAADDSAG